MVKQNNVNLKHGQLAYENLLSCMLDLKLPWNNEIRTYSYGWIELNLNIDKIILKNFILKKIHIHTFAE